MRYIKFVKRNIRRSPFQAMAASMVMLLTFFALLIFLLLAGGSQAVLRYYESKPQAIAFFKDGTTDKDVAAIQNALKNEPRVTGQKYISKEDALKIYRDRNKNDPALLELVTSTILPTSLEISTQTPDDLKPIAEILKREPVVEEVMVPDDVVASLTTATRAIRVVGGATVIFLIIFATLVTLMVIGFKIRLRREEISIMRLIGAPAAFIRAPFILEGMFYGLVGAFASWIFVYILLWYFTPFLQNYLGDIPLLPVNPLFMLSLLAVQLVVAVIVGGLGSISAVRRYLHI
jgi:cell division transport system permease protein